MSQSAVSRQVSGLEQDLGVPLFHRHARGLILTEQGEHLFRTVNDVVLKLEGVKSRLAGASEKPTGPLRLTTTVGLGSTWLTERIHEFDRPLSDVRLSSFSTTRNSASPCARRTWPSASTGGPTSSSAASSP
jgi:DNA-binding transcriptional LysR family regulator